MTDTVRVPREPTEAMIEAAQVYCHADRPGRASDIYRAMLAASPQHEAGEWAELLEWHRERASEARSREAAHDEADAPACAARAHGDAEFHESAARMLAASPQGEGSSADDIGHELIAFANQIEGASHDARAAAVQFFAERIAYRVTKGVKP